VHKKKDKLMRLLKINKEQLITSLFIGLCLIGYVFFPANGNFQYKAVALVFLVLLPFLYNKYMLKRENIFKRVIIGDWKENIKWLAIGLSFAFLVITLIFVSSDLRSHYFLSSAVKNDFKQFLLYELLGVSFTVAIYELFFRGFVMFYFSSFLGKWVILGQFLFFAAMALIFGLPYWFYITYLVFTPFAGWIAYKSNSILYSFFGQLLFIIIVDAVFIALAVK